MSIEQIINTFQSNKNDFSIKDIFGFFANRINSRLPNQSHKNNINACKYEIIDDSRIRKNIILPNLRRHRPSIHRSSIIAHKISLLCERYGVNAILGLLKYIDPSIHLLSKSDNGLHIKDNNG
jgi:hypothetical protein